MTAVILNLLIRRTAMALPILVCVSSLVFVILRLLPADPVSMSLPPGATAEDFARLRQAFGLDRSIPEQYLLWVGKLIVGDFGTSIFFRRPVLDLIATALPATLELITLGLALGIVAGLAGGLAMFAWRGRAGEQALDLGSAGLMAIPEFLWAILLILALGVAWPILPFIGRLTPGIVSPPVVTGFLVIDAMLGLRIDTVLSALRHMVLPATALAIGLAPLVMRVLRSSLLDVAGEDYIRQARLRGLSERTILLRHALRNAVLPTISLIGVQGGFMFGGTVLVEMIFAYPGLGNLMVDAVRNHDLPVIQAVGLVYCVLVLGINAVVDILTLAVNPRLRVA